MAKYFVRYIKDGQECTEVVEAESVYEVVVNMDESRILEVTAI